MQQNTQRNDKKINITKTEKSSIKDLFNYLRQIIKAIFKSMLGI